MTRGRMEFRPGRGSVSQIAPGGTGYHRGLTPVVPCPPWCTSDKKELRSPGVLVSIHCSLDDHVNLLIATMDL